jgi:hypothetical protein
LFIENDFLENIFLSLEEKDDAPENSPLEEKEELLTNSLFGFDGWCFLTSTPCEKATLL